MIKSKRMKGAGHIAQTGHIRNVYKILVRRYNLGDADADGKIILKWILKK
jgi:hypothetical protein